MGGALQGVLVIALEHAVAAPFCSSRLADAGARVIKVERAEGDFARGYDHVVHGESAYFVWLNRGKESIVLDIKDPRDVSLLQRMAARADVFIQNLAAGAAERAGFGAAELRRKHPRLITCDISGYGDVGPYRDMKAYDLLIQCESGLASITGVPERPGRVGVSVADIACGMYAHAGILEALYHRERSGEGSAIAVSLFDCLADWMTVPLLHYEYGGKAPERVGLKHPSIAPYGAFATADGKQVVTKMSANGGTCARRCWSARRWRPTPASTAILGESRTAPPSMARSRRSLAAFRKPSSYRSFLRRRSRSRRSTRWPSCHGISSCVGPVSTARPGRSTLWLLPFARATRNSTPGRCRAWGNTPDRYGKSSPAKATQTALSLAAGSGH
jgi:CoA-transferase family III